MGRGFDESLVYFAGTLGYGNDPCLDVNSLRDTADGLVQSNDKVGGVEVVEQALFGCTLTLHIAS